MIRPTAAILAVSMPMMLSCGRHTVCDDAGVKITVTGNHGHEAKVPKEDVKNAVGGTYRLKGGSHQHAVPVKADQMRSLAEGAPVTTRATSVNAHSHEITLTCK